MEKEISVDSILFDEEIVIRIEAGVTREEAFVKAVRAIADYFDIDADVLDDDLTMPERE